MYGVDLNASAEVHPDDGEIDELVVVFEPTPAQRATNSALYLIIVLLWIKPLIPAFTFATSDLALEFVELFFGVVPAGVAILAGARTWTRVGVFATSDHLEIRGPLHTHHFERDEIARVEFAIFSEKLRLVAQDNGVTKKHMPFRVSVDASRGLIDELNSWAEGAHLRVEEAPPVQDDVRPAPPKDAIVRRSSVEFVLSRFRRITHALWRSAKGRVVGTR